MTFASAMTIGIIDELVQIIIPKRVFDTDDILFNGISIIGAIMIIALLSFTKRKVRN